MGLARCQEQFDRTAVFLRVEHRSVREYPPMVTQYGNAREKHDVQNTTVINTRTPTKNKNQANLFMGLRSKLKIASMVNRKW